MPQPPRSSGCFVHCTYATMSFSCVGVIALAEKRGMRYGPTRTASAIWRGVDLLSGGTRAPITIPPWATIWWQPAQ